MAIGGSLRAALRAGNWAKTAMESRRRARALADLNARGGIGGRGGRSGPEGAIDYLRNTGVDPAFEQGFIQHQGLLGFNAPRGRVGSLDPVTGSRSTIGGNFSQRMGERGFGIAGSRPIEAPYEGFRVLRYDPNYLMGGPVTPEFPPVPRGFDPRPIAPLPPFLRYKRPQRRRPDPSMFFDDITGVDSFIDPQTGFRYTLNGMPLD